MKSILTKSLVLLACLMCLSSIAIPVPVTITLTKNANNDVEIQLKALRPDEILFVFSDAAAERFFFEGASFVFKTSETARYLREAELIESKASWWRKDKLKNAIVVMNDYLSNALGKHVIKTGKEVGESIVISLDLESENSFNKPWREAYLYIQTICNQLNIQTPSIFGWISQGLKKGLWNTFLASGAVLTTFLLFSYVTEQQRRAAWS